MKMTNSVTRMILGWCDDKMEEIENNPNENHPYAKAFGLGAVEGVLDGLVYGGVLLLGLGAAIGISKRKKK